MTVSKFILISTFLFFVAIPVSAQTNNLLSPEESLWLKSRNNTIVIYSEKNNPPFSYQSAGGNIQGLAIDYIKLIAEKVGAEITYLLPQSRSQILNDFTEGKGDVIVALTETDSRKANFIFTDSFVTVPTVIVVRKDFEKRKALTLNDFNGKRVSVINDSALEEYIRENYPRVVLEDVTDDEVSLQQVVLGEVDAAVMDIASLSFYLSKQVLSSVKVVGNTALDYKPAFALLKDKTTLQSILEKGMTQISASERSLLTDKWITASQEVEKNDSIFSVIKNNYSFIPLYILFSLILLALVALLIRQKYMRMPYFQKRDTLSSIKQEFNDLKHTDDVLAQEVKVVKAQENILEEKIKSLEK